MTVICVRDGVMAVDRLMSVDGVIVGGTQKWMKVPKRYGGGFIAGTGNTSRGWNSLRDFAETGKIAEAVEESYVHLKRDGSVWLCQSGGWFPAGAKFVAAGSGMFMALAAMEAGASAEDAAVIACKLMPGSCGGGIDVLRI